MRQTADFEKMMTWAFLGGSIAERRSATVRSSWTIVLCDRSRGSGQVRSRAHDILSDRNSPIIPVFAKIPHKYIHSDQKQRATANHIALLMAIGHSRPC